MRIGELPDTHSIANPLRKTWCHFAGQHEQLVGWLVYSYRSHLEHRASVKRFFSLQLLNLRHSVGLLGRVISQSQVRYLTQTQNKHKRTSMPRVGFEPTIPAVERTKTVHALDHAASVIGNIEQLLYSSREVILAVPLVATF
jgi:hypothetical protein